MISYGSRKLFSEYSLVVKVLNKVSLRSQVADEMENDETEEIDEDTYESDFLVPDTIVALAAELSSSYTVWFIRISNETVAEHELVDDFNHKISAGNYYVSGHYLERQYEKKNGQFFKESKKVVYFFKESVVYPFVAGEQKSGKLFISNEMIVEILSHVENNGLSAI